METIYYVENCIVRILRSECSPRKEKKRGEDLAKAVEIAAVNGGIEKAHEYLMMLCDEAERGKYK